MVTIANKKLTVLAIIPAFCEEENIAGVVSGLIRQNLDVLVVDDCSTDATAAEALGAGARVIRLPVNLGYGGALQTGYLYARDNGYKAVVQLDGDGQHDPVYVHDLLAPILAGEADIVMGSRFLGKNGYQVPWARRLGMMVFGGIAGLLTRSRITDPTTGYQALSAKVLTLYCSPLFPDDYPDADMLIIHRRLGFRIKEVPVKMQPGSGKSMHAGIIRPLYYIYKMTVSIIIALVVKLPRRKQT